MENRNISLPFHWSGAVWAMTLVFLLVLVGVGFHLESLGWPTEVLWLKYLLFLVFLVSFWVVLGYMPIRLKADGEKIAVSRLFGALEIPLSEVISVAPISKSYIDGSIRTFGSGGAGGYLGRFKNKTLGRYTMYATELKHLVLVRTRQKKYVFSCTQPEEFVAYVQARLKR